MHYIVRKLQKNEKSSGNLGQGEFAFHLEVVGDSKMKTLWKRWYWSTSCFYYLSLSEVQVTIINVGEVHTMKDTEGALLNKDRLYQWCCPVIVPNKTLRGFWWKKCEVLHLIPERLNDASWSGNSWGRIWGCFPGCRDWSPRTEESGYSTVEVLRTLILTW